MTHFFTYFYPICSLVDSLYSTKYGLFCFIYLHYIILLWVLTRILHNDLIFWKTSILANFCSFLPYFRPCRSLIWYQISVILCYLFRIHYIIINSNINHSQWTIALSFFFQNIQKTSILAHFRSFLPYFRPCRPLILCQIWVILFYLFRICYTIIISNLNHSQWTI